MKKLYKIEFYFENCETASVFEPDVERIYVMDATRDIECLTGNVRDTIACESFHVKLKKTANKRYQSFGMLSKSPLFERIAMYNDIVSVTLIYCDGSSDEIRVSYDGDETNDLQTTKIDNVGNLDITISKKEGAST